MAGKNMQVNLTFTANTEQAKRSIQQLSASLTQLGAGINLGTGVNQLNQGLREGMQAANALKVSLQNAVNVDTGRIDLGKFSRQLKESGLTLKDYASRLSALGPQGQQAFMQLARSIQNAENPIIRLSERAKKLGVTLANTARWQISSSVLMGFTSAMSSAFSYAEELNTSLNNIRIVTGYSKDEMAEFAKEANRAAKALNTTTTAYTDASLIYYQQGLSDKAVKERTDVTVKLANVTGNTAEQVSQWMTAIWNNFDNGSESLEHYADVITALGAATASSAEEIAEGLEKFAAVAETVGLSYNYATTALATVTAETRQSADVVGTAFKTLFARMQDLKLGDTLEDGTTLGQYSEALFKVGVNIKDTSGNLKEMDTILNELGARWTTLGADQQVALAKSVAGLRQYNQFIALMANWDIFQQNLDVAEASSGALQDQADIFAESWKAASNRVKANVEAVWDSLINSDGFIGLMDFAAGVLNVIDKITDNLGGLSGILITISGILMKTFSGKIAAGLTKMKEGFQDLRPSVRAANEELKQQALIAAKTAGISSATYGGQAQAQAIEREVVLQEKLNELRSQMSAFDAQVFQERIESIKLSEQEAIKLGQSLDLERQKTEELRAQMEIKSKSTMESTRRSFDSIDSSAKSVTEIDDFEQSMRAETTAMGVQQHMAEMATRGLEAYGMNPEEASVMGGVSIFGSPDDFDKNFEWMTTEFSSFPKEEVELIKQSLRELSQAAAAVSEAGNEGLGNIPEELDRAATAAKKLGKAGLDKTVDKTAKSTGLASAELRDYANGQLDIINGEKKAIDTEEARAEATKELLEDMNKATISQKSWTKSLVAGIGGITQAAMGISMLTNAVSSLGSVMDDGKVQFSEIVGVVLSLGMGLGILVPIMRTLLGLQASQNLMTAVSNALAAKRNGSILMEIAGKRVLTSEEKVRQALEKAGIATDKISLIMTEMKNGATLKEALATVFANEADKEHTKTLWAKVAAQIAATGSLLPLLAATLAIVAALAVLAVIVWGVVKAFEKEETESEKIAKAHERLKEQSEELKNQYEELKKSIDDLKTSQSSLDTMIKGTQAWIDANEELESQIANLLTEYPELAQYVDDTADGLRIQEENMDEFLKKQKQGLSDIQIATNAMDIAGREAKQKESNLDFVKNDKELNSNLEELINTYDESKLLETDYQEKVSALAAATGKSEEAVLKQVQAANNNTEAIQLLRKTMAKDVLADDTTYQAADEFSKKVMESLQGKETVDYSKVESREAELLKQEKEIVAQEYLKAITGSEAIIDREGYNTVTTSDGQFRVIGFNGENMQYQKWNGASWEDVGGNNLTKDQMARVIAHKDAEGEARVDTNAIQEDVDRVRNALTAMAPDFTQDQINSLAYGYLTTETFDLGSFSKEQVAKLQSAAQNILTGEDLTAFNTSVEGYDDQVRAKNRADSVDYAKNKYTNRATRKNDLLKALELEPEDLDQYVKTLKELNHIEDPEILEDIAMSSLQAARGLNSLSDSYWDNIKAMEASEKGSVDYLKASQAIRNSLKELTGVEVSDEFIDKNKKLIEGALTGNESDYKLLRQNAANALIDTFDQLKTEERTLLKTLDSTSTEGLGQYLNTINAAIEAGQISTEQARMLFENLGYNIEETSNGLIANLRSTGQEYQVTEEMRKNLFDKRQREREIEQLKEEKTRYYEINKELENIERNLSRIAKLKDNAFGSKKLFYLSAQRAELENQAKANEQLLKQQEQSLKYDRDKVASFGAIINVDGVIENYSQIEQGLINALETAKKSGDEVAEKYAQNNLDDFRNYASKYEETFSAYNDTQDALFDWGLEKAALALEEIDLKAELQLSVSEESLKNIDYQLSKLEDKDYAVAEKNLLYEKKFNLAQNDFNTNKQALESVLATQGYSLEDFISGNIDSSLFSADQIEAMSEYRDAMIENSEVMQEAWDSINESFTTAFDYYNEEVEKGISQIEHYTAIVDGFTNIIDLVGAQTLGVSEEMIDQMHAAMVQGSKANLDAMSSQLNMNRKVLANAEEKLRQAELDLASGKGTQEAVDTWRKHVETAQEKVHENEKGLLDATNAYAEQLINERNRQVDKAFENFYKATTGYSSHEQLQEEYDRQKKMSELYVDEYKKTYELSKLTRDINKSLDNTKLLKGKQALLDIEKQINAYQKDDVKMSQFQVENLRRQYELELAKIQLEEAQNAKSQVTLKQDSEGNWGYVYTANQEDMAAAEQNYEDKLYAMMEANDKYIEETNANMIEAYSWLEDTIRAIQEDVTLSEEERQRKITEAQDNFLEMQRFYSSEIDMVVQINNMLYDSEARAFDGAMQDMEISGEAFIKWNEDEFTKRNTELATQIYQANELCRTKTKQAWDGLNNDLQDPMNQITTKFTTLTEEIKDIQEEGTSTLTTAANEIQSFSSKACSSLQNVSDAIADINSGFQQMRDNEAGANTSPYQAVGATVSGAALKKRTNVTDADFKSVQELDASGQAKTYADGKTAVSVADKYDGQSGLNSNSTITDYTKYYNSEDEKEYYRVNYRNEGDDKDYTTYMSTKDFGELYSTGATITPNVSQGANTAVTDNNTTAQQILAYSNHNFANSTVDVYKTETDEAGNQYFVKNGQRQIGVDLAGGASIKKQAEYDGQTYYLVASTYNNEDFWVNSNDVANKAKTDAESLFTLADYPSKFKKGTKVYPAKMLGYLSYSDIENGVLKTRTATNLSNYLSEKGTELTHNYAFKDKKGNLYTQLKSRDGTRYLYKLDELTTNSNFTSEASQGWYVSGFTNGITAGGNYKLYNERDGASNFKYFDPNFTDVVGKKLNTVYNVSPIEQNIYKRINDATEYIKMKNTKSGTKFLAPKKLLKKFTGTDYHIAENLAAGMANSITGNPGGSEISPPTENWEWAFNTGGYTGSWGPEGRWAMLHQKEIVLNAHDTENFLTAINIVRSMADQLEANAKLTTQGLASYVAAQLTNTPTQLEQNVTIHAEFPNAVNHSEIEEAFGNIINLASQYINYK